MEANPTNSWITEECERDGDIEAETRRDAWQARREIESLRRERELSDRELEITRRESVMLRSQRRNSVDEEVGAVDIREELYLMCETLNINAL